ncbi:hypothetical protein QF038_004259 [Pseudarthrobacter sp. W1I19]|uniref:hypothetical protein n=1 Tax=Pseudarthrobacter sp. W1I19 TaxID=3042288 RepID=UPI00277E171D|nr:hypothetical protein [Pseudarthrobacter sp. W1I19]MDQ0925751.1 hypothetical protein [Pseudarthrobacter sp. W1I19]
MSSSAFTAPSGIVQDPLPEGISVQGVDGGPGFYGRFSPTLPADRNFFPIGVWFESVLQESDVAADRGAGLNTYVQLTEDSNVELVRSSGLHALPSTVVPDASGFLVSDEVDMWAGGGHSTWTGRSQGEGVICDPAGSECGYTIQEALVKLFPPQALLYSNYGKGVTFQLKNPQAAQFVNGYQDVVSADNYWFTDPYICSHVEGGAVFAEGRDLSDAECRTGAHYGWTVDRVRSLVQPAGSKPVWAFVEVGHPFSESDSLTISPAQLRSAVWSSLIHGARGIVYFNHNFGGQCQSQHVLRDECGTAIRPTVTAVNNLITKLAPVLNSDSITGLVTASSKDIEYSVKASMGHFYVFAASTRPGPQTVTFSVACGRPNQAEVLDENRSVAVANHAFADTFSDADAVHIYRLDGGNTCGLG